MRICAVLLAAACAHAAASSPKPAGPQVALSIAPETVVSDPVLVPRGTELRAALARALSDEGFRLGGPGAIPVTTSIDYTPWTALSPSSLYVTARVEGLDEISLQRLNEGFDAADLARELARKLAASPRLAR